MSHPVDIQMALLREAKRLGKKPDELTSAEVTAVVIKNKPVMETVAAGVEAIESFVATKLNPARRVPLPIYEARKGPEGCGGCPKSGTTKDGRILCRVCGCSGALMESALWDVNQACRLPKGQRRWEKYVKPA